MAESGLSQAKANRGEFLPRSGTAAGCVVLVTRKCCGHHVISASSDASARVVVVGHVLFSYTMGRSKLPFMLQHFLDGVCLL